MSGFCSVKTHRHGENTTSYINIKKIIGKGVSSRVMSAVYQNESIAIKEIDLRNITEILREIYALKVTKHPNLLLPDSCIIDDKIYTNDDLEDNELLEGIKADINGYKIDRYLGMFPLMDIDLRKILCKNQESWSLSRLTNFTNDILSALTHLQSHQILHRDIKPENILYDTAEGRFKLGDWGLATNLNDYMINGEKRKMTPQMVTIWYRSLEILKGSTDYSFEIDIFSLGCILCEIILGTIMFDKVTISEQLSTVSFKLDFGFNYLSADIFNTSLKRYEDITEVDKKGLRHLVNISVAMLFQSTLTASKYQEFLNLNYYINNYQGTLSIISRILSGLQRVSQPIIKMSKKQKR